MDAALLGAIGRLVVASLPGADLSGPQSSGTADAESWVKRRLPYVLAAAGALDTKALALALACAKAPESEGQRSADEVRAPPWLHDAAVLLARDRSEVAVFTAPDEEGEIQAFVYWGIDGLELSSDCAAMIRRAVARYPSGIASRSPLDAAVEPRWQVAW